MIAVLMGSLHPLLFTYLFKVQKHPANMTLIIREGMKDPRDITGKKLRIMGKMISKNKLNDISTEGGCIPYNPQPLSWKTNKLDLFGAY